jgi:hypothetical protein
MVGDESKGYRFKTFGAVGSYVIIQIRLII